MRRSSCTNLNRCIFFLLCLAVVAELPDPDEDSYLSMLQRHAFKSFTISQLLQSELLTDVDQQPHEPVEYQVVTGIILCGVVGLLTLYLVFWPKLLGPQNESMNRQLWNVAVVLCWLFSGSAVVMLVEEWHFTSAIYVMAQIVTTVGYGDITVHSHWMMMFMTAYVLFGIVIVANIVNDFADRIIQAEQKQLGVKMEMLAARNAAEKEEERRQEWYTELYTLMHAFGTFAFFVATWAAYFTLIEGCSCSYGVTRIPGCLPGPRCQETGGKEIDYIQGVYMAVISMTTVGFGDFTPVTRSGRLFAVIWTLLGVASTWNFVQCIAGLINIKQKEERFDGIIDEEIFRSMDKDGTGSVDREEFHKFILLKEGLVSQEDYDRMDRAFDAMDKDHSGSLSMSELSWRLNETTRPLRRWSSGLMPE